MKGKGMGAIKGLALRHGEKVVMLLVLICVGLLVYSTLSHTSLPSEHTSDKLTTQASQVREAAEKYSFTQAIESEDAASEVRVHQPIQSSSGFAIDAEKYPIAAFDGSVVPPLELRKDPELLPPVKFEGHGVTGLFAFLDDDVARSKELAQARDELQRQRELEEERKREAEAEERRRGNRGGPEDTETDERRTVAGQMLQAGVELDGSEDIQQLSCAVVTAKVPLAEQLAAYKRAFGSTRDYDAADDLPQYLGYKVERADVTSGGEGELEWQPVLFRNGHYRIEGDNKRYLDAVTNVADALARITHNWPQGAEDEFAAIYANESLTMLPAPLVGRNWQEMAYHSDVPTQLEYEEQLERESQESGVPTDGDGGDEGGNQGIDFDSFSGTARNGGSVGRDEFGGGGFNRRRGGGEFGGGGGFGRGGNRGGDFGGGGSFRSGGDAITIDESNNAKAVVDFLMLRFFDMTVQPGKMYKYRVRLILVDPNYNRAKDSLSAEVAKRNIKPFILADWSEPSGTIAIPQAGVIRIGAAEKSRGGAYDEPEATMLIETFGLDDRGNALQVSKKLENVRRGAVMDYVGEVEALSAVERYIETVEDFKIDTGVVVLDLDGGESYTRELLEPTHALLMDASGRLYLRDELDDELEMAIHKSIFEQSEDTGPGGRGNQRDFGGEFGGEFGF